MGNFVDTARDEGVFNSDSWDGDGINSRCCLEFGTKVEEYLWTGIRAIWASPIVCVIEYERTGVGDTGSGAFGRGCVCDRSGAGGCAGAGEET